MTSRIFSKEVKIEMNANVYYENDDGKESKIFLIFSYKSFETEKMRNFGKN